MSDTKQVSIFFGLVKYAGILLLVLMAACLVIYGVAAVGNAINPHFGLFGLFRTSVER